MKTVLTAGLAAAALLSAAAPAAAAEIAYALQGNKITIFSTATPDMPKFTGDLTGVAGGEWLTGIDFRPANNKLYGVGSQGTIYTIARSGSGFVATPGVSLNAGGMPVELSGTNFGFDFNPVADRLRMVSGTEQSLRINVATGVTIVDGALNDGMNDPTVIGAAYTNNFPGATMTTLYGINASNDSLVTVIPPNSGLINTVAPLGVDIDTTDNVGFDIARGSGDAFFSVNKRFYSVNLTTGASNYLGDIAGTTTMDFALKTGTVPEPATWAMMIGGFGLIGASLRRRALAVA